MLNNTLVAATAVLLTLLTLSVPTFAAGDALHETTYVRHIGANEWGYVTVDAGKGSQVTVQARVESPQPHDIHVDNRPSIGASGFQARFTKTLLPGPIYVSKDADGAFSYKPRKIPGACALWLTIRPRKLSIDVVNDDACGFKQDLDFSGMYTPYKSPTN